MHYLALITINLDTDRIMDELVGVNFERDRLNLDNEMKRKDLLFNEQPRVLDVKSLDCTSHEPCLTKYCVLCFHCDIQEHFSDKCPLLKTSSMKNASFIQKQLELINFKLDFLTKVVPDKYPSSFVHSQEFSECSCSFKKCHSKVHDHVNLVAHTSLKPFDSCL
jgi:hypothetical protein